MPPPARLQIKLGGVGDTTSLATIAHLAVGPRRRRLIFLMTHYSGKSLPHSTLTDLSKNVAEIQLFTQTPTLIIFVNTVSWLTGM
jgi:hypothetical protein